jgi:hypothetical protein
MTRYAGLDVSDKLTHVCVVDATGAVLSRAGVASDPEVLAHWLKRYARDVERVVLETGPLSTFLYHELVEREIPVTLHSFSAVSVYFRFPLSLCLAEDRRLERGNEGSDEAIHTWAAKLGPAIASKLERKPARPDDIWPLDALTLG